MRSTKKNKITSKPKDFKILALQTSYKKTPDSPKLGIPDVQEEDEDVMDLRLDLSKVTTDTPKQFSKPPAPSFRPTLEDSTPYLWASEPKDSPQIDYNKIIKVTYDG